MTTRSIKVALVASIGGHITELLALKPAYADFDHFYVFNEPIHGSQFEGARAYSVTHSERDVRVLTNVVEFLRIFRAERPSVMLSTGAGQAVAAALAAKLLGIRVAFVDSLAATNRLSLAGCLVLPFADTFYVQWPQLANEARGIYYSGNILGSE